MKRAVAFLLALFIFVAPVTTLVKADVVIGDNDNIIVNENATILGRKLALLESFSDLALSGVTEFSITNTNDVDSYLDYLWEEIGDAIDSLSNGTGFTQISNSLKSKYFTNLVQYRDYITNRGTYLSQLLPTGSPTTTLLSTFFADNIYGKQYTQHYDLALDMFKSLSQYTNDSPSPVPSDYIDLVSQICSYRVGNIDISALPFYTQSYMPTTIDYDLNDYCLCHNGWQNSFISYNNQGLTFGSNIITAYITTNQNDSTLYDVEFQGASPQYIFRCPVSGNYTHRPCTDKCILVDYNGTTYWNLSGNASTTFSPSLYGGNTGRTLTALLNDINNNFKHINLYVNGVLWGNAGGAFPTSPTVDIDGFLKIYNSDDPVQYELEPQTKIDYDQLYQVIYNAIRDNLPINQGDINYYDSHDTIYSPTIINNYGEEEGDESDLIDTILDYAVIPKFDTAIAQPMRQALTNGVVIMNTSVTDVIPNEILLILGACFFLLLFAVVINRMIK